MNFLSGTGIGGDDAEDHGDIIVKNSHYWAGSNGTQDTEGSRVTQDSDVSIVFPKEQRSDNGLHGSHLQESDSGTPGEGHGDDLCPGKSETYRNLDDDEVCRHAIANDCKDKCAYCGLADACSIVQCGVPTCKKWFCNGRGRTSGAHIIAHMIRAKHKEIRLHPEGMLGDTTIECFVCGRRNIFVLGFVPSKADSVVILLCREPCLGTSQIGDTEWDASTWLPLVEDRQFLPWLVKVPDAEAVERTRQISQTEIQKLEDLWKTNVQGTLQDLEVMNPSEQPEPILFTYDDAYKYESIFSPLVTLEARNDESLKAQVAKENTTIQWTQTKASKVHGRLNFSSEDANADLVVGDELKITHPQMAGRTVTAIVVEASAASQADEEYVVDLVHSGGVPRDITHGYAVKLVWRSVTYDRMKTALHLFAQSETSMTSYLYHRILGHTVDAPTFNIDLPTHITAPGLPMLNPSQAAAVRGALVKPLSLIQGPPGTGKTVTAATLVYQMCRVNQSQILVTAPSNVAVDHLVERIHRTGLKVVRISARNRESLATNVEHLSLHHFVKQYTERKACWAPLKKLMQLRSEAGGLKERDEAVYLKLLRAVESEIIANADIVCTTCVGAGAPRISHFRFKHVVIDESTQACEPETLIPLVLGCRQAVLIGDHCQLGPVITSRPAVEAGLSRSMFERLVLLGARPFRLQIQYRMHPAIAEFPANMFYEGTLQNGVTHNDRIMREHFFPWPDENRPMFFYNNQGQEEISASGTSYLNRTEAALVEHCVTQFLRGGVTPDHIGVITPYRGQSIYIANYLARNGAMPADLYRRIEIFSVDAFQGREKQYIIFSCVRSNMYQGIGFLRDARRLNVALTRAQCGLILIGNARVLSRDPLWHALLVHFRDRGLIVEGPLEASRSVDISLTKPRRTPKILADDGGALPATVNAIPIGHAHMLSNIVGASREGSPAQPSGPLVSNDADGSNTVSTDAVSQPSHRLNASNGSDLSTMSTSVPHMNSAMYAMTLNDLNVGSSGYDAAMLAASDVAVNAALQNVPTSTQVVRGNHAGMQDSQKSDPTQPPAKSFLRAAQQYLDHAAGGTEFYAKSKTTQGWQ